MTDQVLMLTAAAASFVGTHFVLSHPLRAPVVDRIGEKGFAALYSVIALATFAAMALAFRAVPDNGERLWNGQGDASWAVATIIMLIAAVLLTGSFRANPAMPAPDAAQWAERQPQGVFAVTRHPMMWSFALWAAAHVLVSPSPRVIVLALAIATLALVGAMLQDRKKMHQMGDSWAGWAGRTSFMPQLLALPAAGVWVWLGGIALWLGATWLHGWLVGMPAGIWRWI